MLGRPKQLSTLLADATESDSSQDNTKNECANWRRCFCGSEACEKARLLALELLDSNHLWSSNNGFTEIKHSNKKIPTDKVEALHHSCAFHLGFDKDKALANTMAYYIASIHWPVSIIQKFGYQSTPISSLWVAKDLDTQAGYGKHFADDKN